MRRRSTKMQQRIDETEEWRWQLVYRVARCEICGHDPGRVPYGGVSWRLVVHEIARGGHRYKALDKGYAVLVLCWWCHETRIDGGREHWSQARQLAALRRSRPEDFDLAAFNALIGAGPNRITVEDVDKAEADL